MSKTTPEEQYLIIKAYCKRAAASVIIDLQLPANHAEDIEGRLFVHMLKLAPRYREGARSFKSYCWKLCRQLAFNEREYYRADKRGELLLRTDGEIEDKEGESGCVSWVEQVAVTQSKAAFITDFRERYAELPQDERSLLDEMGQGIPESQSKLGLKPDRRKKLIASLRSKFGDLRFFLTRIEKSS